MDATSGTEGGASRQTGAGLYMIGSGIQAGAQLGNAWAAYFGQRLQAGQYRMQASAAEFEAGQGITAAKRYWGAAAGAQRAGWQEAAMRGQRLAQDVGRVYTGAAGAGIDVSSDVVRHVERTNRTEALADMDAINANATAQAQQLMAQSGSAMAQYHIGMGNAAVMRQNAKIARTNAWGELVGGVLSSVGTMVGGYGMAKAMSN